MAKLRERKGDDKADDKGGLQQIPKNPLIHEQVGGGSEKVEAQEAKRAKILCSHGIHEGEFEVGGMTVGEAKKLLAGQLNIPEEVVSVAGGDIINDDFRLGPDVAMLSFVKKASVKGNDAKFVFGVACAVGSAELCRHLGERAEYHRLAAENSTGEDSDRHTERYQQFKFMALHPTGCDHRLDERDLRRFEFIA